MRSEFGQNIAPSTKEPINSQSATASALEGTSFVLGISKYVAGAISTGLAAKPGLDAIWALGHLQVPEALNHVGEAAPFIAIGVGSYIALEAGSQGSRFLSEKLRSIPLKKKFP
jgi:hypothetical protein